ncbi:MAG: SusC/RagA family TonB-linked outer membrane protein [bacterium]
MSHLSIKTLLIVIAGLFFSILLSAEEAFSQESGRITGTVLDGYENTTLPGATIVISETQKGTASDAEGRFELTDVPPGTLNLKISFVGYLSEEITIELSEGETKNINVELIPDLMTMDEVVVVGYGTQRKQDMTGSVSQVNADDLQRIAISTAESALQGQAPGVFVSSSSSPGSGASIHIRGVGSINGTEPLWVVDGVVMGRGYGNEFNPQDIESLTVLKDASAAAIYGSQAANGVILVETKKGKTGEPKISFRSYAGISNATNLPELLNVYQYAEIKNQSYDLTGTPRIPRLADVSSLDTLEHTDWIDVMFDPAIIQSYETTISGGSENNDYYIGASYFGEEGTVVGNNFERFQMRINTNVEATNYLKFGQTLNLSRTEEDPRSIEFRSGLFRTLPYQPVYDENVPYGWGAYNTSIDAFDGGNPLAREMTNIQDNNKHTVNGTVYGLLEPLENLTFKATLGLFYRNGYNRHQQNEYFFSNSNQREFKALSIQTSERIQMTGNFVLSYARSFENHNFDGLIGYESLQNEQKVLRGTGENFIGNLLQLNAATAPGRPYSGIQDKRAYQSVFGRLNYNYSDKYLLSANIRRDGTSVFGEENRYGVFPSISGGWVISEEEFMSNSSPLSFLKLRSSYGILGSDAIGLYQTLARYTSLEAYAFGNTEFPAVRPDGFPNQALKWESISQLGIGLELGFFDNRLRTEIDYYRKETHDMLVAIPLPLSSGLHGRWYDNPAEAPFNIGSVRNSGWDFLLIYQNEVGDLSYRLSGNANYNENEVLSLAQSNIIDGRWLGGDGFLSRTEEGSPIGYFYGYRVDGIFQNQQEVDEANELGDPNQFYQSSATGPGDIRFKDLNNDGRITSEDREALGNPWPKLVYGFSADVQYRNWDLNVFFQGVYDVDVFNTFKFYMDHPFSDYNTSVNALDRWQQPGDDTDIPRILNGDPNQSFSRASDRYLEDASYLRLKNIQIGYSLSNNFTQNINPEKIRIYLTGQNVFTLTNYSGLDPDIGGGNTSRGIDNGKYPLSRTYMMGVQINF